MNPTVDPLANLQPLHMPPPVSWWPPAPGWWLISVFVALLFFLLIRFFKRGAGKRYALSALKSIDKKQLSDQLLIQELNVLLKRYALICFPDSAVAKLSGKSWLNFLQEKSKGYNKNFFDRYGHVFSDGLYRDSLEVETVEISGFVKHWIKKNNPAVKGRFWSMS